MMAAPPDYAVNGMQTSLCGDAGEVNSTQVTKRLLISKRSAGFDEVPRGSTRFVPRYYEVQPASVERPGRTRTNLVEPSRTLQNPAEPDLLTGRRYSRSRRASCRGFRRPPRSSCARQARARIC